MIGIDMETLFNDLWGYICSIVVYILNKEAAILAGIIGVVQIGISCYRFKIARLDAKLKESELNKEVDK